MSGERWVRATWRKEEWQLGEDGIVTLPEGLDEIWRQRCWASSILPTFLPSKMLHKDERTNVEIWGALDTSGNDCSCIVRYENRDAMFSRFEQHVDFLLKFDSAFVVRFATAFATESAVCMVLQPVPGGNFESLVQMKNCGPLPEAFLSEISPQTVWLGSDSLKLGICDIFVKLSSPAERDEYLQALLLSLPSLLWAPGGFVPDRKYADVAAALWPLRKMNYFMKACTDPSITMSELLELEFITFYENLPYELLYSWYKIQGEYERFKFARNFHQSEGGNKAAISNWNRSRRKSQVPSSADAPQSPENAQRYKMNRQWLVREMELLNLISTPNPEKESDLIKRIFRSHENSSGMLSGRGLRTVFLELKLDHLVDSISWRDVRYISMDDFLQLWENLKLMDIIRDLQIQRQSSRGHEHSLQPFLFSSPNGRGDADAKTSETIKKILKICIEHWKKTLAALRARQTLREFLRVSIWGKVGKAFIERNFEDWHVHVMTRRLGEKRDELRAIFARNHVKQVFRAWVDFCFIQLSPTYAAENGDRERTPHHRIRRHPTPSTGEPALEKSSSTASKSPEKSSVLPKIASKTFPLSIPDLLGQGDRPHDKLRIAVVEKSSSSSLKGKTVSPITRKHTAPCLARTRRWLPSTPRVKFVDEDQSFIEDHSNEGYLVSARGIQKLPSELRSNWIARPEASVRSFKALKQMLKRESVEVWEVQDNNNSELYNLVAYPRKKETTDLYERHLSSLLTMRHVESSGLVKLVDSFATSSRMCLVVEHTPLGHLGSIVSSDACGPLPEPILSLVVRQLLRLLQRLHAADLTLGEQLSLESVWVCGDGRLKLGVTSPMVKFSRADAAAARRKDLSLLAELCGEASRYEISSSFQAREELEAEIRATKKKLGSLKSDRAMIDSRRLAHSNNQPDRKQVLNEESRRAEIVESIGTQQARLDELNGMLHKLDEIVQLFPISFSSKGRCNDFVSRSRSDVSVTSQLSHPFISNYMDLGYNALLRWMQVGGTKGEGNKLAKTLYEMDPAVEEEMEGTQRSENREQEAGKRFSRHGSMRFYHPELRRIFDKFAKLEGKQSKRPFLDLQALTCLIRDMFPGEFTQEEVEEGFKEIDRQQEGRIHFGEFAEWWTEMNVSDKLGLVQARRRAKLDLDLEDDQEKVERGLRMHLNSCFRRCVPS
ncbi:hypothetical protein GUITHDRAFT_161854 [Guillardia theta CCMP2712]|uniref:EF-hand domain-containing protein n=1 Tax=Guillardia theta (strain CCMP2712) TaxID=905079 RepID=L1JPY0_GUITC|nr:hypothetical protein GUITHDRAFT_161854 [Guillardia theta CCMP2712]EKX50646.1 hypothetical protein GUITHDRAFT_161854 [Guillardia theta CCMP2712]|eukprot:XP_005837626.1 hypothetical protein GUITHDRAFT_161854 [Guillardia theta CCMP2712]